MTHSILYVETQLSKVIIDFHSGLETLYDKWKTSCMYKKGDNNDFVLFQQQQ